MAKYQEYDYSHGKFIPINFDNQILPGTFEYALHCLVGNEVDRSVFDFRFQNDQTDPQAAGLSSAKPDSET